MKLIEKKNNILVAIHILLLSILLFIISIQFTTKQYIALKIILTIGICISLYFSFNYIIKGDIFLKQKIEPLYKYKVLLICIILISFSPLITESFFFHDDYINFLGYNIEFFPFTFSQGRQITGLFTDIMSFTTVKNSYYLRYISVIGVITYGLLIQQFLFNMIQDKKKSTIIAITLSLIIPVVNVISYGSMFIYVWSFVFSLLSVITCIKSYEYYKENKKKSFLLSFALTIILLIISNLIYQVTTTVAFLGIALYIYYCNEKKYNSCKVSVFYIFTFGLSTGIYYISVNVLSKLYNIPMMGRGNIISTIDELIYKIEWFIKTVINENLKQAIFSFLGPNAFNDKWAHYTISFNNNMIGIISIIVFSMLLILSILIFSRKNKNKFKVLILISTFPLSYFVFLILKESSYTSYYSVALCSIMMFLVVDAVYIIINRYFHRFKGIFVIIILMLFILNANHYARNFWVDYNKFGFEYLKTQIKVNYDGEERIHIYGTLYPGQADIYTINATKMALKELNISENIEITTSTNKYFIEVLTKELYESMINLMTDDEINYINRIYNYNDSFGIYTLQAHTLKLEEIEKLKHIFTKCKIIPEEQSENIYSIDLTGII